MISSRSEAELVSCVSHTIDAAIVSSEWVSPGNSWTDIISAKVTEFSGLVGLDAILRLVAAQ